jgi:hypothetical protein
MLGSWNEEPSSVGSPGTAQRSVAASS